MMATSARPSRRSSAHCEGTVNERSYLCWRAPRVKPYTNGAVLRYCTTEMRSFLKTAEARGRFSITAKIYAVPTSSSVKPSGPPEVLKMKKYCRAVLLVLALEMVWIGSVGALPDTSQPATIAEKTANTQKMAGYFNLYWDAKQGKLWLEIDNWNSEFLYQSGLSAGIGSNDIGLNRGQLGATRIVRFERSGPKVLLVQENLDYRAISDDQAERRAVHDSFAESILAGFTVGAAEKDHV